MFEKQIRYDILLRSDHQQEKMYNQQPGLIKQHINNPILPNNPQENNTKSTETNYQSSELNERTPQQSNSY